MTESNQPLRLRIEDALGQWAQFVARHRWSLVAAMTVVTIVLGSFVPSMVIKMASEDFLFEDDPVRARYDAFKEDFGQDQISTLSITPPEIFDLEFLTKLAAFHRDLENEVPFLEDLTSLVNVRSTYGRGDELVVEDLLDDMPTTEAELIALRDRVLSTPFYVKTGVLSSDGGSTGVRIEVAVYGDGTTYATETPEESASDDLDLEGFGEDEAGAATKKRPFLSGVENAQLIGAIQKVIDRYAGPDFPILAAGGTMMTYEFTQQLGRDVPLFFGGGLLVIGILLIVLFRRFGAVLLAIAVVVPASISTFGLASYFGIAFSAPAQLVPSFLLAIGVSYSVHLVTIFMTDRGEGQTPADSLEHALRHSGLPILMTGMTTAAGLLSFMAAEMKPIQEMGMISTIGVAVMLCYSMVLLPALLSILPLSGREAKADGAVDRILAALAVSSARHPWPIVIVTAVLVVGAFVGMTRLYASSDPVSWFPDDHPYRVAADLLGERYGGTSAIEIVIDTGRENGIKDPELMRRLEQIEIITEEFKANGARLSHTNSIVDIVKETHQALNENDPEYYAIPSDPLLLSQELLLFENSGSDDLEKVVDSQFSRARYTVRSYWTDGVFMRPFLDEFEPRVREAIGEMGEVQFTGMSSLMARTVDAVQESMLRSYALALALITPLMIILIGSLRSGLVSMVPNLVPILLTLGLMGFAGIPLDMFTLLAGCIAIGLAVDDSIHFISGFGRYRHQGYDPVAAVERTMQTTGRALLFTSIALTMGFAVLLMSEMLNLRQVGALTTFAIAAAFLLDVTVTPALLVLTHRKERVESTEVPTP